MKKIFSFIILLFSFALPASADTGWKVSDFESEITILSDGLVKIEETIQVVFDVEKHGIYRDMPIAYQRKDGSEYTTPVKILSVTNGQFSSEYSTESNGANLRIKIGDANRTVAGEQTYKILYTVEGGLSAFDSYDELYWNVTGNEWGVPIDRARATIHLPGNTFIQASCYFGKYGSSEKCGQEKTAENTILFTHDEVLAPGEGMTIAVGFEKGTVPIIAPKETRAPFSPFGVILVFLATSAIGIFVPLRLWWKNGRDMKSKNRPVSLFEHETIIAEYETPEHLRPGEIGVLIDEKADTLDITATIVDLASRGYLTIEEIPKKWFLGSVDYKMTQTEKSSADLLDYEAKLLSALFKSRPHTSFSELLNIIKGEMPEAQPLEKEVKISELREVFYKDLEEVKKELYEEITKKELFADNPDSVRKKYIGIGVLVVILGFGGLFLSAMNFLFLGIGGGLVFSGVILIVLAQTALPKRTVKGHSLYQKALGYKLFVSGTEKYRAPFYENQNMFIEVLPYAIVFGVTKKLADAMKQMGIQPQAPVWYHGANAFNAVAFAGDMENFSTTLSTAMASAPGGSGSGGGGFSGGGGGGGGGGSW